MSSLTNNTTNRISSSSSSSTTTTYPSAVSQTTSSSSFNSNTVECTTSTSIGLAAMGLAAASLAAASANGDECDSKVNVSSSSTSLKLHHNTSDDPYASFYALNRALPQSGPPPG